jgi:hypothetical protein
MWDAKENGALIIVLWNALILHARWGGLVRERGLMNLALVGNIVTAWSWFGVNMLGIGLHSSVSWTRRSGGSWAFVVSQLALDWIGSPAARKLEKLSRTAAATPEPVAALEGRGAVLSAPFGNSKLVGNLFSARWDGAPALPQLTIDQLKNLRRSRSDAFVVGGDDQSCVAFGSQSQEQSMISSPVFESRLPVGSSAMIKLMAR